MTISKEEDKLIAREIKQLLKKTQLTDTISQEDLLQIKEFFIKYNEKEK